MFLFNPCTQPAHIVLYYVRRFCSAFLPPIAFVRSHNRNQEVRNEKMLEEEDTTEYLVEIVLFEPPTAAWGNIMNKNVFIAPGAHVIGDVHLGENVGVWYNAVVRGDTSTITIGDNSNVQDNATIHTDSDYKVHVGKGVTIGHNAIVHGCTVGDNTVIGMGSIVLSGAVIGDNCIIGAGSLVTGKTRIPDNSLAFGNPAKVVRTVTETEIIANQENAAHYVQLMKEKK